MKTIEEIASDAMLLSEDDRIVLAHRLLDTTSEGTREDYDAVWDAEIKARMDRHDRGETAAIDIAEAFAEIDKKLGR